MASTQQPARFEQQVQHPSAGSAWSGRTWLPNGRTTSVHVATYPLDRTRIRLHRIEPEPVEDWCRAHGFDEAINGGFFTKPGFEPLGDVVVDGAKQRSTPFREPWDRERGALLIGSASGMRYAPRHELRDPEAGGHLLQSSPLLVLDGVVLVDDDDPEGLSTTCDEFDSDITDAPYPRMAIARSGSSVIAAAADGRSDLDDGLTLTEWASVLVGLGAIDALNLDGGSSSALVTAATRRNSPRDDEGVLLKDGYPTATIFTFTVG